jgi:ferritin-like metal-binding protein YciE
MGRDEEARLLHENLEEEKAADTKLTGIAESSANREAEEASTAD